MKPKAEPPAAVDGDTGALPPPSLPPAMKPKAESLKAESDGGAICRCMGTDGGGVSGPTVNLMSPMVSQSKSNALSVFITGLPATAYSRSPTLKPAFSAAELAFTSHTTTTSGKLPCSMSSPSRLLCIGLFRVSCRCQDVAAPEDTIGAIDNAFIDIPKGGTFIDIPIGGTFIGIPIGGASSIISMRLPDDWLLLRVPIPPGGVNPMRLGVGAPPAIGGRLD